LQLPAHGSNPSHLYEAMGIEKPEQIIDFSVNTNPLGAPTEINQHWQDWLEAVYDYPDAYCTSLKKAIASNEGVDTSQLLIGNGAAEIITLIARYLRGKTILIMQPAFSEYETACLHEQCTVDHYITEAPDWQLNKEDVIAKLANKDAVFICQPNNPTGVQYEQEKIDWLIEYCQQSKILLVIDEAFYDFTVQPKSAVSKIRHAPYLLILRSLTKMYNIAGLRLGFLVGQSGLLGDIASYQAHWSVNAIALEAGELFLRDGTHANQTRTYIDEQRIHLFSFFNQQGFSYSPSAVNFYLIKDPTRHLQQDLFIFLLKKGFVLRHTVNFPGLDGAWLRAAIKTEKENQQLMRALNEWKQQT